MNRNDEEEDVNQHRRSSLEGLDEVRYRQDGISKTLERGNEDSPPRIHAKTQVKRCIICKKTEQELEQFTNEEFTNYHLPFDHTKTLTNIIGKKDEKNGCKLFFMCKWCYRTIDFLIYARNQEGYPIVSSEYAK